MRTLRTIGIVLMTGAVMGLGCQLIAGVNTDATYAEAGSGGNGGMASTSSSSSSSTSSSSGIGGASGMGGTGGMGGMSGTECNALSDCINDDCKTAKGCDKGVCVWDFKGDGTPTGSQLFGDCKDRVCDGNGGVKLIDGDPFKDTYDWANPCFENACTAFPVPMPKDGVTCTTAWGFTMGKCAEYKCIECTLDADCASVKCQNGRCVSDSCANSTKDLNETDIDCGGPDCVPCVAPKECVNHSDCEGSCDMMVMPHVCLAPSCADTVRNGDETDIDCGGLCAKEMPPKKCAVTMKCLFHGDCETGVCKSGVCIDATCKDYTQNQGEDAIDCGGPCSPCPPKP